MQRTHEENLVTRQGQISNDAGSNKCSAIPSNIEEDYSTMTLSRLGFVFSTHANAFRVILHSKKLFPWFISAKFWRVAIQVLLKISLKTSIIVSFILAAETRSIFPWKSPNWAMSSATRGSSLCSCSRIVDSTTVKSCAMSANNEIMESPTIPNVSRGVTFAMAPSSKRPRMGWFHGVQG